MTTQSVKQWLYDRIVSSGTVSPGTFPRDAVAGLLYNAGLINTSTLTVLLNRPVQNVDAETVSVIMINVPGEDESQVTTGGLIGNFRNDVAFQIDLIWVADLTGDPANNVAPLTDEPTANRTFRKYAQALRKTLRACFFQQKTSGQYIAGSWVLTDPDDGFISRLAGTSTKIKIKYETPMVAENGTDIFFGVSMQITIIETFTGTGL